MQMTISFRPQTNLPVAKPHDPIHKVPLCVESKNCGVQKILILYYDSTTNYLGTQKRFISDLARFLLHQLSATSAIPASF